MLDRDVYVKDGADGSDIAQCMLAASEQDIQLTQVVCCCNEWYRLLQVTVIHRVCLLLPVAPRCLILYCCFILCLASKPVNLTSLF